MTTIALAVAIAYALMGLAFIAVRALASHQHENGATCGWAGCQQEARHGR